MRFRFGLLVAGLLTMCTAGCSLFGGGSPSSASESVFSVKPGQCFQAPKNVTAQLSKLSRVPCSKPHTQEAYALPLYASTQSSSSAASGSASAYPGADVLTTFAQGACAQQFRSYVGIDYLDSSLYFTYLLPSARSWEQDDDRKVICFITSAKGPRTASAKGSKS